jgi:hypothetical protein
MARPGARPGEHHEPDSGHDLAGSGAAKERRCGAAGPSLGRRWRRREREGDALQLGLLAGPEEPPFSRGHGTTRYACTRDEGLHDEARGGGE